MEIQRAFQIATREWENIKLSLSMCGDIGEFNFIDFVNNGSECLSFLRNTIEMENKFPAYRYLTPEAAYVFTILASKAAERLGLRGGLAQEFGNGYSWVRTGRFDLKGIDANNGREYIIKQLFFFRLFFPLGGDFTWDFNSQVVKVKLKVVSGKFTEWQDAPRNYVQDVRDYKNQLEQLLFGLSLALDLPLTRIGGEYINV
ncbi:MAG TPA: hypothetical protein VHT73_08490 [Thermodesulfobacteriota bacterium]|nr:hypothetical protein [Thermodesulfobacteriota bacterium]